MKTTMRNSAFLGIVLFAALSVSSVVKANDSKDSANTKIEFKYVGKVENQPLFQLSLNNPESDEYTITVVVEVVSKKTKKTQTFTIDRRQSFVDETVVAKVD